MTDNNTDSKQGEALLPCPFCGGAAGYIPYTAHNGVRCLTFSCPVAYAGYGFTKAQWNFRASVAAPQGDAELYQTASRVLRWLYATMNPKLPIDKSLLKVTQFEIHAELERAVLNTHAAQVRSRIAAASSFLPAEPPPNDSCSHWREGDSDNCVWCGDDLGPTTEADVAPPAEPLQPEGEQEKL